MFLPAHFHNSNQAVMLYGTTPPRLGASSDEITRAAETLVERIQTIHPCGIVVYDVQDESERTQEPRPFPFLPTIDSRAYSQMLHDLSGYPVITYKAVGQTSESEWEAWLAESVRDFGIQALSLVGHPSRKRASASISLGQATEMAMAHQPHFDLGAVAIAERHSESSSESKRMIQKGQIGCEFFISQSVYDSHKTITLLNDYVRDCQRIELTPKRFMLTFAPCGHVKTLNFIKWLGVSVPGEVERRILKAKHPLEESIEMCRSILGEILSGLECKSLPLGINVESVSNKKDEIDASLELFRVLGRDLKTFLSPLY